MLQKYSFSIVFLLVWGLFTNSAQAQTELLSNNEFDDGTNNWQLWEGNGTTGTFEIDNTSQLSGANSAKITLTNTGGGAAWELSFAQGLPSPVSTTQQYELTFTAKASSNVDISFKVQETASPWASLFENTVSLTSTSQNFAFTFTPTGSGDANFLFSMGAIGTNTQVWIDNVHLTEGTATIDKLQLDALKVFPNPVQNHLNLQFKLDSDTNIGYKIIDITGKEVIIGKTQKYETGQNHIKINVENLVNGIYLMILNDDKHQKTIKFTVNR